MPVSCKLIDGVYRLVEPDGSIVHNAKHETKEACQAQATAINMNQKELSVVYLAPDLEAFTPFLSLAGEIPLVFEKELIYEGQFVKSEEGMSFDITTTVLSHWSTMVGKMLANGVEIPVPVEHTTNPEKKRGNLLGTVVKKNKRGKYSLFGRIQFIDEEAARLAKSADVSIFAVPEIPDGHGNIYKNAIRHVALTNYPVIPHLEGFQAIAASFGELKMSSVLLPIAQRMGIQRADQMNDIGLSQAIVEVFDQMTNALKGAQNPGQKPVDPNAPPDPNQPPDPNADPNNQQNPNNPPPNQDPNDPNKKPQFPPQAQIPAPMAASFVKILKDSRIAQLDALVLGNNITKACRDEYEKLYCTDENLTLCLSNESVQKDFDNLVTGLKLNKVMADDTDKLKRAIALSNPQNRSDNPLVSDAEDRAKAAVNN